MDINALLFAASIAVFASEPDKVNHMIAGAITSHVTQHETGNARLGCISAIAIGIVKEQYDRRNGGYADWRDAVATASIGCAMTWRF